MANGARTESIEHLKRELPPTIEMVPGLKPKTTRESAGPCPKCGGTDRFVVKTDGHFWCRQCGFKGDNLDLYCHLQGKTVKELLSIDFGKLFDSQTLKDLPAAVTEYLSSRGLSGITPFLLSRGLVGWYQKEKCLTFPMYHPRTGRMVGIQRIPVDRSKKKVWQGSNMADGVLTIEGEPGAPEIVVEAVMDGLSARLSGEYTVVILFSASTVKKLSPLNLKNPVFFFDNDDAGRKATEKAAEILPDAKSVDWSIAPANCKDLNDLFRTGHLEAINRMVETARRCSGTSGFDQCIFNIREFCQFQFPERRKYLPPWLQESSIILVTGYRGVGKTFFEMGVADAVTGGKQFGQWTGADAVPTLILDGEMTPQDMVERSEAMGLTSERKAPLYLYSDAFATQHGLPRAHLANEEWRIGIKEKLLSLGVKLWFVDNIASLSAGLDENSKQDWDPINQWLIDLRFAGITTTLLHHVSKDGHQRGTSAREDNIDISIVLKPPCNYQTEDGARFVVHFSKARVRTSELHLLADTEFKLTTDQDGRYVWTWGGVRQQNKVEILRMLDDGVQQKEIAEQLGISKGQVSKLRSRLVQDGFLTAKNRITQDGFSALNDGNFLGNF